MSRRAGVALAVVVAAAVVTLLSLRALNRAAVGTLPGLHFFVLAATWSLPLVVHDLWALARERGVLAVSWIESRMTGPRLTAVQAAGVGVLASLTLVLRSTTSLDFI